MTAMFTNLKVHHSTPLAHTYQQRTLLFPFIYLREEDSVCNECPCDLNS